MNIPNKRAFFTLWEAGLLGNRPPLWRDVRDIPRSIPRVGFRELGRAGGGAWTLVPRAEAEATAAEWTALGRTFVMDGSVPNDKTTLQGELRRTEDGMVSYLCERASWACRQLFPPLQPGLPPMRQTIAAGWHRHRGYFETLELLNQYLDPSSRDDVDELFDLYPDAVIEFSAFSVNTGNIPGRNTIIWEVRCY